MRLAAHNPPFALGCCGWGRVVRRKGWGTHRCANIRIMSAWQMLIDILGLLGVAVSVAGLVLTVKALNAARGAEKAARDAVNAARRRDAASDFQELAQRAANLLVHVQERQPELALVRAGDLFHFLQVANGRWSHLLGTEDAKQLSLVSGQIRAISNSLSNEGIPESAVDSALLIDRCHELIAILAHVSGNAQSITDRQVHEYR